MIRFILIYIVLTSAMLFSQKNETVWGNVENCTELNSSSNDFAPSWNRFEEKLYFNSDRTGVSKFYIASCIDNIMFQGILEAEINEGSSNRSYITFLNSEEAYLTSYSDENGFPVANIYSTKIHKNQWSKEFKVEDINTGDFNSQATVSPAGDILIIVSNRGNNFDDTDLWMAYKREDGLWSSLDPCNMINSPGKEITPYLKSSDTLFFASNGLGGPGGFDLYKSVRENGKWQRPQQINHLNTEFDESDLTFINNNAVVFASNRPGGKGQLDLYTCYFKKVTSEKILYSDPEISFSTNREVVNIDHVYEIIEVPNPGNSSDYIKSEIRSIKFDFDELIISFDARPREVINEWNCYLTFGDLTTVTIQSGDELPARLNIDLSNYKEKILVSDELNYELVMNDSKNQSHIENIQVVLNKSEVKKQPTYEFGNQKFYYSFLYIPNNSRISPEIKNLDSRVQNSKRLVIQYFDNESKSMANNILNKIKDIVDESAVINTELSEDDFELDDRSLKNYFRILY